MTPWTEGDPSRPEPRRGARLARREVAGELSEAFGGGMLAAGLGLGMTVVVVLLLWIVSPYPDGDPGDALHVAADLWLLAHGAALVRDGAGGDPSSVPVALTPLLLSALPCWLLYRAARQASTSSTVARHGSELPCRITVGWLALGYLLVSGCAVLYASAGPLRVVPSSAVLRLPLVVAAVVGVAGYVSRLERSRSRPGTTGSGHRTATPGGSTAGDSPSSGATAAAESRPHQRASQRPLAERTPAEQVPAQQVAAPRQARRAVEADAGRTPGDTPDPGAADAVPDGAAPELEAADERPGSERGTTRAEPWADASRTLPRHLVALAGAAWEAVVAVREWTRQPRAAVALRAGGAATLALLAGGLLLTVGSLVGHADLVRASLSRVSDGWVGCCGLLLLSLTLVPNAAVWGAAYGLGPGFAAGGGGTVAPLIADDRPTLPHLPLLAAVPGGGWSAAWLVGAVVPVAAGIVTACWVARAAVADPEWRPPRSPDEVGRPAGHAAACAAERAPRQAARRTADVPSDAAGPVDGGSAAGTGDAPPVAGAQPNDGADPAGPPSAGADQPARAEARPRPSTAPRRSEHTPPTGVAGERGPVDAVVPSADGAAEREQWGQVRWGWWETAVTAAWSAVVCAASMAVLAVVSGGAMGNGAMARLGPDWWLTGPAALLCTTVLGVPGALLLRLRRIRVAARYARARHEVRQRTWWVRPLTGGTPPPAAALRHLVPGVPPPSHAPEPGDPAGTASAERTVVGTGPARRSTAAGPEPASDTRAPALDAASGGPGRGAADVARGADGAVGRPEPADGRGGPPSWWPTSLTWRSRSRRTGLGADPAWHRTGARRVRWAALQKASGGLMTAFPPRDHSDDGIVLPDPSRASDFRRVADPPAEVGPRAGTDRAFPVGDPSADDRAATGSEAEGPG